MKPDIKIFTCLLLFACFLSYGQMEQYNYTRELKVDSGQWHKIILPDEIFSKTNNDLSDIRIFGITKDHDTIEAPYLMRILTEKVLNKEVAFRTLNTSHNNKGYYFTFEIPATEPINQIKPDFKQQNFDWRIKLEGSQNQDEWFTIIEDYRILSIKNELTDFQFTTLNFPTSKYRYFRLYIDSKEKPDLTVAGIAQHEITEGIFSNYSVKKTGTKNNKHSKQTEIDIELPLPVPVSYIRIDVSDTFDYYRPLTIQYLSDSIKTEKGWKYNYNTLTTGTLNSIDKNEFKHGNITVQKMKVIIHNQDNRPLTIDTIQVKGYMHELVVRFTEQATYFLTYGNKTAARPQYDLDRFAEKVPKSIKGLELGNELRIEKDETPLTSPLFKNKVWLWAIMTVIIILLGWFSLKMIKNN